MFDDVKLLRHYEDNMKEIYKFELKSINPMRLLLLLFFISPVLSFGQTPIDLKKEITEHKFTSVKNRNIPLEIIKLLGCDSYEKIGTKATQTGCTSGKNIVIFWAMKDSSGVWIMHIAHCGRARWDNYYIVSNGKLIDVPIADRNKDFKGFKVE